MDKNKADYEKYINYYNNYNPQNRRRTSSPSNGSGNEDEHDTLSDKKTNETEENVLMEDTQVKNKVIGASPFEAETNKTISGSFDPFSALEKMLSISDKTKKQI